MATFLTFEIGSDSGSVGDAIGRPGGHAQAMEAVQKQLQYAVGQLNEIGGIPHLTKIDPRSLPVGTTDDCDPIADPSDNNEIVWACGYSKDDQYHYRYAVNLPVVWLEGEGVPSLPGYEVPEGSFDLVVPRNGVNPRLFFAQTKEDCSEPGHQTIDNYWYYYHPKRIPCPLMDAVGDPELLRTAYDALVLPAAVVKDTDVDRNRPRWPEYGDMRTDGAIHAVFINGVSQPDPGSGFGSGDVDRFEALISTVQGLLDDSTQVDQDFPDYREVVVSGSVGTLQVEVTLQLIHSVTQSQPEFRRKLRELFSPEAPAVDVIMYGGHSNLGGNIRALAGELSAFLDPSDYHLIYLRGCNTYTYTPADFLPSGDGSELDLLLTARPVPTSERNRSAEVLLRAVLGLSVPVSGRNVVEPNFLDLTRAFGWRDMAVVVGEENNRYEPDEVGRQ